MLKRGIWVAFVFIFVGVFASTLTQAAAPLWERDTALFGQVVTEIHAAGSILAVRPHAKAMEKALKGAAPLFAKPISEDGKTVVLTDGQAETFVVLAEAAAAGSGDVAAIQNPYPHIGLLLGSFYVETGKFRDALRVLEKGLALSPLPDDRLGEAVPDLLSERGITLTQLKRWDEALASYDRALGIKQMDDHLRAMLHRGRGFVLVELGRLDEATKAYKRSLDFDPRNPIAANELAYIAALREGMKPVEPALVMPGLKSGKADKGTK